MADANPITFLLHVRRLGSYQREQDKLASDEADNEMVVYHEKNSHSTDAVDSLSWRHEFLLRKFFEALLDVELKDDQRLFMHEQRLEIYRRDGGFCKIVVKCQGRKCEWDNWAADHVKPWSKGGKTTVENGQVGCIPCNSAKKDSTLVSHRARVGARHRCGGFPSIRVRKHQKEAH